MGESASFLLYHIIWSTSGRRALLTPTVETWLYPYLEIAVRRIGCRLHSVGGVADHVHLALQIPAAIPVSNAIGKLKVGSAHHLHREIGIVDSVLWEDAHAISTHSVGGLPLLVDYIRRQKEHHRAGTVEPALERIPGPAPAGLTTLACATGAVCETSRRPNHS